MGLVQFVYVSSSNWEMTDSDLMELLEISRERNLRDDITGFLMYYSDAFMQVVEGPEAAIDKLYQRLLADGRHSKVTQLVHRPLPERLFKDWSMAFKRFDRAEEIPVPGFSQFLEGFQKAEELGLPNESDVTQMIEVFRHGCASGL